MCMISMAEFVVISGGGDCWQRWLFGATPKVTVEGSLKVFDSEFLAVVPCSGDGAVCRIFVLSPSGE